jgi:CHAT domain-containing protein
MQEQLHGNSFIYDRSTLSAFKNNAGRHKIIHIGTHAESNNLHPEFSRVIFAKDTAKKGENNSLYLFDIYNCELTSNLTVLTACETGRPGYQDGEGMISLAHAFNYAGSESIITGLWKIDEQASAMLMNYFYENLLEGMEKDEALRLAKLKYLSTSGGRTLAPQYWAGLVLMGDTAAVSINQEKSFTWVILLICLLVIIAGYFFIKRSLKVL